MDEGKGAELDSFIGSLPKSRILSDDLGGGQYIVSGYGNLGRNTKRHPPDHPSMRLSLQPVEHLRAADIVGGALSRVACCVEKYCNDVYRENQKIMRVNPNLQWPAQKHQTCGHSWMSAQFIVRHWGGQGLSSILEKMIVSGHVDRGDLDTMMPSIYYATGGKGNKGGYVLGTDLALFEEETGGAGVRIRTCIRDTVVVVLSNSRQQLHGCILDDCGHCQHGDASPCQTTRIIPFIPQGVYDWMVRNQKGVPFNIP